MKQFLFALIFLPVFCFAQLTDKQQKTIDSLQGILKHTSTDTILLKSWKEWGDIIKISEPGLSVQLFQKIDSLSTLRLKNRLSRKDSIYYLKAKAYALNRFGTNYYYHGANDSALTYFQQSLQISESIGDLTGSAGPLNNIGIYYFYRGDYGNAILFFKRSLKIREETADQKGIAAAYNNIGLVYDSQGNYANAIEYYTKSLNINEKLQNKQGLATALSNIGNIYYSQDENEKAITYFEKSLIAYQEIGDKQGMAVVLTNMGNIYNNLLEYDKSIEFYQKSKKLNEDLGYGIGISAAYNNIGSVFYYQGNNGKAIEYLQKALGIRKEMDDKAGVAFTLKSLGTIYYDKEEFQKSLDYNTEALQIAQSIGSLEIIRDAANNLWLNYKKLKQYTKALEAYELYIVSRDSLFSEENQEEIIRQKFKYEYEKKATADSVKAVEERKVKEAMLTAEKAKTKQKEQQSYFLYAGLLIAILFGAFIFNRFRITNKQKGIIALQKDRVDLAFEQLGEKNKEIVDSITYAKRIQMAILPPMALVQECFDDFFILYKPKDIVAGDFYWLERKDNKTFLAVADCTGHGVPGALVSVVCNNALNRSVREYGLTDPGAILDKSREIVINEFEKSEEDVKDGMDLALCILEGNMLQYAGANNPLWIIRNGDNFISEIKANKQPIGKFYNHQPYTRHTLELNKGDCIYLFSDGYVDQFGGTKNKKFKAKALRELLLALKDLPMQQQGVKIEETFDAWKGNYKQLDDVCMIGFRY